MTIELISQSQFDKIKEIKDKNPKLTFENKGYEYIKDLSKEDKKAVKEVEDILKNHILGFSKFNNFREKNNEIEIRLQYNYGAEDNSMSFIGVGYIMLNELKNGFNK